MELSEQAAGKIEEQLQMALETPEEERSKTLDLDVGYNAEEDAWELIVRYYDTLRRVEEELGARVVPLLNNFAVVTIAESKIPRLTEYPQVLYVESPKKYYYSADTGREASCVNPVQSERLPEEARLYGRGVLIAIPDSGIDYFHPDFRNEDGSTRILALWDQSAEYDGNRYGRGRIFWANELNESLQNGEVLSSDGSGHGTGVAGIAAGNGRASGGRFSGVAPEAELVIIKLGDGEEQGFARTTSVMFAVDFALRIGGTLARPLVINLSYGTNYGAHNGEGLFEEYLDEAARVYRCSIVIGTGNEGLSGRHARVNMENGQGERTLSFVIANGEPSVNLQIWKNYFDEMRIFLEASSGEAYELRPGGATKQVQLGGVMLLVLYGEATPYTGQQEIYVEFLPSDVGRTDGGGRLSGGSWRLRFLPIRIRDGNVDCWLPAGGLLLPDTRFLTPTPETTLTIPSTAVRGVAVGAYDSDTGSFAAFSGQGYDRGGAYKPDLVAPGVEVYASSPGGGYARRTGTSFAAPFVTGSAAILMEWGVVRGNDPFLYGEKLKYYLLAGAKPVRGVREYPDPRVGWGALCLADSFPNTQE